MAYIENDGGRSRYFAGRANDCAARAMAIALGRDYRDCYDELATAHQRRSGERTARKGVYKADLSAVLARHGWHWQPAPVIDGRKARCADMPEGAVIVRMARHFSAVIDGIAHDVFDPSDKMVYGYWQRQRSG